MLEDLPWRSLGLTFHQGWLRDLCVGFAIGFAALAVAVGDCQGPQSFSLSDDGLRSVIASLIGSSVLLFVAALAEEAMFRGYGLQTLSRAKLRWLGILLTSVPFGLVHLDNPNVVPGVTFVNTALAGVWMAVAYCERAVSGFRWDSLVVELGAWLVLRSSDQRLKLVSHPLLEATDSGPKWLTGGSYGIEGGVACTDSTCHRSRSFSGARQWSRPRRNC